MAARGESCSPSGECVTAARFRCHEALDLLGCVPVLGRVKEYGDRVFAVRALDEAALGELRHVACGRCHAHVNLDRAGIETPRGRSPVLSGPADSPSVCRSRCEVPRRDFLLVLLQPARAVLAWRVAGHSVYVHRVKARRVRGPGSGDTQVPTGRTSDRSQGMTIRAAQAAKQKRGRRAGGPRRSGRARTGARSGNRGRRRQTGSAGCTPLSYSPLLAGRRVAPTRHRGNPHAHATP